MRPAMHPPPTAGRQNPCWRNELFQRLVVLLLKGTVVKTIWIYIHASIASIAWLFILLAWFMALLDPRSGINQDPVFAAIAIVVALGHLSAGSYLVRRIRQEISESRQAAKARAGDPRIQPSS